MENQYHLIGIGGIGMSGIAKLLLRSGSKVSGSDLKETMITEGLKKLGARIFIGHNAVNIKGANLTIYSSAIKEDNPEFIESKRQNIPLIKRAQALAQLMNKKVVITVAGSHGKTTTASLASCLLSQAGLEPCVAVGGILRNIGTNSYLGNGDFFVAEADESDGSFLYYRPKYSIITNIDREHLDYYKEFENELLAFREFLGRTENGGCVFCCADDSNLKKILADYNNRYVLFGMKSSAQVYPKDIQLTGLSSNFDCFYKNKFVERFHLSVGGEHNISNSLSVIALGLELGIDLKFIKETLAQYKGVKRRLEIKFVNVNYMVIDDYAHHPSEIEATLAAVRNLQFNRAIIIFQPHRYTRTKLLLDDFAKCFRFADYLIITDIYPAGESPIEGINGRSVYDKIKEYAPDKEALFLPKDEILAHILKIIKPRDLVITLGAGDIVKISDELAQRLS